MKVKSFVIAASIAALMATAPASAQGIPVIDAASIAQAIEQFKQGAEQLQQLEAQLKQAQELYGSLNGLTNMGDVASLLNKPEIRQALPEDFAAVEDLLSGKGSGRFGDSASQFLDKNVTYKSDADDYYAKALAKSQKQNAGQLTLGEQIYNAGTERIKGIDELRQQISKSATAKETADLSARIQTEMAALQADNLRMQGLAMVQQAQLQVAQQNAEENHRNRVKAERERLAK